MEPKKKGNAEERKQAKDLAIWMFNDPDVLKRHATSGMDKSVYTGDVVPMKQLQEFGWKKFNFMIECKTGYPNNTPSFWNYEKVSDWYRKAKLEGNLTGQNIILLICQFKNRAALVFTNQHFDGRIMFSACIPIHLNNGTFEYVYVYNLKELLKREFKILFEGINYKGDT